MGHGASRPGESQSGSSPGDNHHGTTSGGSTGKTYSSSERGPREKTDTSSERGARELTSSSPEKPASALDAFNSQNSVPQPKRRTRQSLPAGRLAPAAPERKRRFSEHALLGTQQSACPRPDTKPSSHAHRENAPSGVPCTKIHVPELAKQVYSTGLMEAVEGRMRLKGEVKGDGASDPALVADPRGPARESNASPHVPGGKDRHRILAAAELFNMITRQFQLPALTDAAKDYAMRMLARHETTAGHVVIRQGSPDISKLYIMTAGSVARAAASQSTANCTQANSCAKDQNVAAPTPGDRDRDEEGNADSSVEAAQRANTWAQANPRVRDRNVGIRPRNLRGTARLGSTSTARTSGRLRRPAFSASSPSSTARSGRPRRASSSPPRTRPSSGRSTSAAGRSSWPWTSDIARRRPRHRRTATRRTAPNATWYNLH